jgi:hypothetical protein
VVKNLGNTTRPLLAISAFCASCMGSTPQHREPGVNDLIRECSAPDCPLFHFRPYKTAAEVEADRAARDARLTPAQREAREAGRRRLQAMKGTKPPTTPS